MDSADRILKINESLADIIRYSRLISEEPEIPTESKEEKKEPKKKDPIVDYHARGDKEVSVRGMIELEHPNSTPEQIDKAIKRQQDSYNSLSDDAKARVRLMYGDPTNPNYWTGKEELRFSEMPSHSHGWMVPGFVDSKSIISINSTKDAERKQRTIDHEMAHSKQYDQFHQGINKAEIKADRDENFYQNQTIEVGAENRAAMRHIRRATGALRPIPDMAERLDSRRYHESDYNMMPHARFPGGAKEPDEIENEIRKNYLPNYIGMKPGEKPSNTGKLPANDTRMA